jgi:hypothetical protein
MNTSDTGCQTTSTRDTDAPHTTCANKQNPKQSQGVPIILWGDIAAMLLAASACLLPPGSKFNLSWNENVYSQSAVYALNISANVCLSISFFIEFVYPRPRRGMIATLRLLVDVFVIVSSLTEIDPSNAFGNGVFKAWFVFRPIVMLEGFKSIESVSGGIERGFFGAVIFTAIFMVINFLVANIGYMMIGKTALGQGGTESRQYFSSLIFLNIVEYPPYTGPMLGRQRRVSNLIGRAHLLTFLGAIFCRGFAA